MKNNGTIVNVNKLMHEYSNLRIKPDAIKEISGRIKDIAPELDKIAQKHGRKTIYEEDIIEALSFLDQDVI